MVHNLKNVGRPLEFDPDSALEKVMMVFWEKGFEGTSLEDLEKVTNLNRPSLYNHFGSKRGLFLAALRRYHEQMTSKAEEILRRGNGLADLDKFFIFLEEHLRSPMGRSGCLMANSMVEFADDDPEIQALASAYHASMRRALLCSLNPSTRTGKPADSEANSRVELIIAILIGINVSARAGLPIHQLKSIVDGARQQIENWKEK